MNLLIVVRGCATGLGYQTRNLTRLLDPYRVLYIDSTSFNGFKQHPEWYEGYYGYYINGIPKDKDLPDVLKDITHILTCETPYNYNLLHYARQRGIKTYIQANWEFLDYAKLDLPLPTKFLMPSHWFVKEMKQKYYNVDYLPPPIFKQDFERTREHNQKKAGNNILHVMGKKAHEDRNGTNLLIEALKYTDSDFHLTITCQGNYGLQVNDSRVTIISKNIESQEDIYYDKDLMILPRRYGGLCMPMIEALTCNLPVYMPNCSPNNVALPEEWLIEANHAGTFEAKQTIDLYNSDPRHIAEMIDAWCLKSTEEKLDEKNLAYGLSKQYHAENLKKKYLEAME